MKKILFVFCCFWAVLSVAQAQGYDTLAAQKHSRRIIRNAPFVFKARQLGGDYTSFYKRYTNQAWLSIRWVVVENFKGGLSIGDTIETHHTAGCYYNERNSVDCPMHGTRHYDLAGEWTDQYFFGDTVNHSNIFKSSKRALKFYDDISCAGYEKRYWGESPVDSTVFTFISVYPTEGVFLKTLYECLKPIKTENIELKFEIKRQNKRNKKKIGGTPTKVMPTATLNVYPSFYRVGGTNVNGTWLLKINITSPDSSFVREMSADFTYDTRYFPTNLASNPSFWSFVPPLETAYVNGVSVPAYTMTMTNVAANKIRVTVKLVGNSNLVFKIKPTPAPEQSLLAIEFKPLNHNLTCLTPFGIISNVNGSFDLVRLTTQPSPSGNYNINLTSTDYRISSPTAPCATPTVVFTPTTIRSGTNEYLYIRPYNANGPTNGFGWTKGKVWFRDAHQPNDTLLTPLYVTDLDTTDLRSIDWTDTLIKVKVPSLYLNPISKLGSAGSGKVVVQLHNQAATAAWPSLTKLHIEYATTNYQDANGVKKRPYLLNQKCRNNYKLRCDTSLSYSYRRCIWEAAKAWNFKLGYEVFSFAAVADTLPVIFAQADTLNLCIMRKKVPWLFAPPGYYVTAEMKHHNKWDTKVVTNDSSAIYNDGFEIRIHPTYIYNNRLQTDLPTFANGNYTFSTALTQKSFYSIMLHELGHGIGIGHAIDDNHNDALPSTDREVMYFSVQPIGTAAADRQTLTSGNGESLKGGLRVFNDSKNINWKSSAEYDKFAQPISILTSTQIGLTSTRKICGYGNSGNVEVKLIKTPNTNRKAVYEWKYQNGTGWYSVFNSPTFTNQDSVLILKNNNPTIAGYKNINNMVLRCTTTLAGCVNVSDSVIFKASGDVILAPTPSRCLNATTAWNLPVLNPTNGTFSAYNLTTNQTITNVDSTSNNIRFLKKWKFNTPSTFKIIYTAPIASYCPPTTITTDSTWFSTFADCTPLNSTTHKIYINEIYKDNTPFRNDTINDPCKMMKLNFTALGSFLAGDVLSVKLSDANGVVDMTNANILQRVVGTYTFAANEINKTDSIKLTIGNIITTQSSKYQMQMFLRRTALPIEWGEKSIQKIKFKIPSTCSAPINPPCTNCGGRLAPTHFTPEEIALYPNPTTDRFTLQVPEYEAATEVLITDIQGRIIDKRSLYSSINEIETNELPNGIYFVRIAQGERSTVLKLVIVK
jgi:Secretion system C-terminal sorting domain